jgi:hypothetical protein
VSSYRSSHAESAGDRDRFVAYLQAIENVAYETIAENVRIRDGKHDFDYLLQDSANGLLALEVTWLTDPPELIAESMRNVILDTLAPLKKASGLPGAFVVDIPYDPQLFCSSRGVLVSKSRVFAMQLRNDILRAAQGYVTPKTISTEIGSLLFVVWVTAMGFQRVFRLVVTHDSKKTVSRKDLDSSKSQGYLARPSGLLGG